MQYQFFFYKNYKKRIDIGFFMTLIDKLFTFINYQFIIITT